MMSAPPRPRNEAERLALLRSYGVLDTEPEPGFDDITRLASLICAAPIAIVTLIDQDRGWFKARVGFDGTEAPREISFCSHAVASPRDPLIVRDTFEDARFFDSPFVTGEPKIRFYVGVPLVPEDDCAVGTLCVADRMPRALSSTQLEGLKILARQVTSELRRRKQSRTPGANTGERASAATNCGVVGEATIAGRYRLDDVLGVGGMGLVVGATDLVTGRPVAIKFVLPEVSGGEVMGRFVREARLLTRLDSEHVTRILDVGNLGNGAPYIVMERLFGSDLEDIIEHRAPLPYVEAIDYMLQACAGVAQVHAAGILHRDLKPSNLFLTGGIGAPPVLKILDLGIAKLREMPGAEQDESPTGATIIGSPHYMAPEQMSLGNTLDVRTDVWSLGIVLYELLAYHRPFDGDSPLDVCVAVSSNEPVAVREHRPDIPARLEHVVTRCLAKDRSARYTCVTELAEALVEARAALA